MTTNDRPALYLTLGGHGDSRFVAVHRNDGSRLSAATLAAQPSLEARWARENPGVSPSDALREKETRAEECRLRGADRDSGRCTGPFGL